MRSESSEIESNRSESESSRSEIESTGSERSERSEIESTGSERSESESSRRVSLEGSYYPTEYHNEEANVDESNVSKNCFCC